MRERGTVGDEWIEGGRMNSGRWRADEEKSGEMSA